MGAAPDQPQALADRARIVLLCASWKSNSDVAAEMRVSNTMVGKWRNRFVAKGSNGLLGEPRPGAPRKITDKEVERVITLTLESKPKDATQWSTRGMAKQ